MKTLNRTLSLVLVLVMVLGLFGVASAKFNDDATIQYKEAVDVAVGIGAIDGYADGTFNPKGDITREEAAKLITYAILGPTLAKTLSVSNTGFSDVAAGRWSAPFITYLVNKGIINGMGDGTFDPTGKVTGYQLAKMLLVAAGYGKHGEYAGSSWELNTAVDAGRLGVFTGSKATNHAAAATREEAALYVFNGLTKIDQVNWSKDKEAYEDASKGTIADVVYPTLTENALPDGDDFGRPVARTWEYKGETISTTYSATPVATFTTPVTLSALYNTFKTAATVSVIVDGGTPSSVTADRADVSSANAIGGYGKTTELYKVTAAGVTTYTAVVMTNYLAKVTKVVDYKAPSATTAEVKASVELTVYPASGPVAGKTFETAGFAKDQFVVVTMAGGVVKSVAAANSVDGVMTAYATGSVTVGTTKLPICAAAYNLEAGNALAANQGSLGFKDTYTFYVDANNAVIGAALKTVTISKDYVYVASVEYKNNSATILDPASQAAKAKVVFADGTAGIIDLAITNEGTAAAPDYKVMKPSADGTVAKASLATAAPAAIGNWFAYTKGADGAYTLTAVSADYAAVATDATLNAKATTAISGKYTTSATVVTAVDSNGVKTSFTGFPAADLALTGKVLYTYAKGSSVITGVYAVAQAPAVASVDYAYAIKAGNTTAYGQEWIFAVKGAQVTYVVATAELAEMDAGKIYTLTTSSNSTYTVAEVVTAGAVKVMADETVSVTDTGFFVTSGGTYVFATSYGIFNVDEDVDPIGKTDTLAVGDEVTIITINDKVVAVYITVEKD